MLCTTDLRVYTSEYADVWQPMYDWLSLTGLWAVACGDNAPAIFKNTPVFPMPCGAVHGTWKCYMLSGQNHCRVPLKPQTLGIHLLKGLHGPLCKELSSLIE